MADIPTRGIKIPTRKNLPLSDYFKKVRGTYIPSGLKAPHPLSWKGQQHENSPRSKITNPHGFASTGIPQWNRKVEVNGKRRRLTPRQIVQAKLMLEGHSRMQARRLAGYSEATILHKPSSTDKTVNAFFESINAKMFNRGITQDFVADKMKGWFDAKRKIPTKNGDVIEQDDYKAQLGAFDRWREMTAPKDKTGNGAIKKQMTLTEFVTGEEVVTDPDSL